MAKVKEITVTRGRTVGLPGFSSIRADASLTLTIEEDEDYEKVYQHAWHTVDKQVSDTLKEYISADEDPDQEWLRKGTEDVPVVKG